MQIFSAGPTEGSTRGPRGPKNIIVAFLPLIPKMKIKFVSVFLLLCFAL